MFEKKAEILTDFWYLAMPSAELRRGQALARSFWGEPVLLARDNAGQVFAISDLCPHRGIPLRYGDFDGSTVTCCYHGWKFDRDGRCTEIPSLVNGQELDVSRVRIRSYPCRESQGLIWIYYGSRKHSHPEQLPEIPRLPGIGDRPPQVAFSQYFPCDSDQAAFGLMDPTHAAFVHTSWWWKKQARKLRVKEKSFEPDLLGWRMKRHRIPPEHRVYRLLGNEVTSEVRYSLPGLRVEYIRGDRHCAVALTAITPLADEETEVHQCLYWTMGWLNPFRYLIGKLAGVFLDQDRRVVVQQQEGLAYDPPLMLIDDADTQARWYYRLKKEWIKAQQEKRPFENPISPCTLRWRS